MFYHPETGRRFAPGVAFELNEEQFPANWFNLASAEEKTAKGFVDLLPGTQPAFDPQTQTCVEGPLEPEGGAWTQTWQIVPKSPEELAANAEAILRAITNAIQSRLDDFARERRYDDIKSLADYAGDSDPVFNLEGTYGKQVRSQTWRIAIDYMNEVKAGTKPLPSGYADIEPLLPALVWPD